MSNLLGIAGILLTIIFGYYGIKAVRNKKYPGKISFFNLSTIGLFDSFIKNFPSIEILYDKTPIDDKLVYLKGLFLNSGEIDIEPHMIEEDLRIEMPNNFRWLNAKITYSSSKRSKIELLDNILLFNLGLFKKKEKIEFEAILKVTTDKNPVNELRNKIKFLHRISNTQSVIKESYVEKGAAKYQLDEIKKILKIIGIIYSVVITIVLGVMYFSVNNTSDIYKTTNERGEKIYVTISKESNANQFLIQEYSGQYSKRISLSELSQLQEFGTTDKIPSKNLFENNKQVFYVLTLTFLAIMAIMLSISYPSYRKLKKKIDVLHSNTE